MTSIAENGVRLFELVDIFRSFEPEGVRGRFDAMQTALENSIDPVDNSPHSLGEDISAPPPETKELVMRVREARQVLLSFVKHEAITADLPNLADAYVSLQERNFGPAHDLLTGIRNHHDLPSISTSTVELAYSEPITYLALVRETVPPGDHGAGDVTHHHRMLTILEGYRGPEIPSSDLLVLQTFMQEGAERKRLLENEALRGLGGPDQLIKAIHSYAELLPPAVTAETDVFGIRARLFQRYARPGPRQTLAMAGIFATWTGAPPGITAMQKFAAVQSAFTHLELGDALFRAHRRMTASDRHRLSQVYVAATRLVVDSGLAPSNAVHGQVQTHATRQRRKLAAGLNVLGLAESFVPVLRYSGLARAADAAINELVTSTESALASLRAAEDLIGEKLQLAQEQSEEDLRLDSYLSRIKIASLEEDKADEQVKLISDQKTILAAQTITGLLSNLSQADPKRLGSIAFFGAIDAAVNFRARQTELGHQLEIAKSDVDIAQLHSEIAEIEAELSRRRIQHLEQRLDFMEERRVDADLYLVLARLYEKRAARHIDAAIFLAYLAERALTFARGEEVGPIIRFDYWDNPDPEVIDAPERWDPTARLSAASKVLQGDFLKLSLHEIDIEDRNLQPFQEHLSLSTEYPLEFARLLQEGETYFEYSLYQLSKRFPYTYKCRMYAAAVEITANGPASGPRGVLEHTGAFLIRDRKSTITSATRLVPTEAEVRQERQRQRSQGDGVAAINGVLYYVLEPDPLVSTLNSSLLPVNAPEDLLPEVRRKALEGYGPTGLWRLELHNLEELRIAEIVVHFGLIANVDTGQLETRIEELVHQYETELAPDGEPLDKISAFSLQELDRFVDLRTGAATVPLEQNLFPPGLANLKFKALVALALDADGNGVEGIRLRYGRPDAGFSRDRVTLRAGFSEDLDAGPEILPVVDRFPVEGSWQVELLDRDGQFPQLEDVRLFVMYSYQQR